MAEISPTLESNTTSDDLIIKSIQQTIDFQLGLIPESRADIQHLHDANLFTPDQIDRSNVKKGESLVQNEATQIANFNNSSQIAPIDEKKPKLNVGFTEGLKRNENTEIKKQNWPWKKGKGGRGWNKHLDDDFERISVCDCDKRGGRARVVYFREEIESLRYDGIELQKKKWIEIYCGLGSVMAKEYDDLVGSKDYEERNYVNFDPRPEVKNTKGNYVNFDPPPPFKNTKGVAAEFLGNGSEIGCEVQIANQSDNLSGVNVGDLDGEEEYYEDEDSDSELASIQRPAFLVTGEPDFDSGPPQDGLEYLRRVRWEAKHISKVKIAKVEKKVLNKEQTVYMPSIPDIAACPQNLMPPNQWEDVFLDDFAKLRLALSEFESSASTFTDQIAPYPIPLAQSIIETAVQENLDVCDDDTIILQENPEANQTEDNTTTGVWPSLRIIMEMEPRAHVTMLRKRIASVEQMSSLGRPDCEWLFALCAAIDTPLDADTSASLRCLLRKCAALRADKSSLDDEVIMLNILATISGKYFGQLETS